MTPYLDTNFFSRLYLRLAQSEEALHLAERPRLRPARHFLVTWLHRFETINAFQLCVFAGKLRGQTRVTPEQASAAQASFRADLAQCAFLRVAQVGLPELEAQFEELALRHTSKHGFRTYDLLHVASALLLRCDTFWSFDPKASRLADLEGLRVR